MLTNRVRGRFELQPVTLLVALIAAHVSLALVMRVYPSVGTVHAFLVVAFGVWFAIRRNAAGITYACVYIAGSEVLWRMTNARVFWEFAKYAIVLILLVAIFRSRRRPPGMALIYFALLLPSAIQTVSALDLPIAQQAISFNLSGPLAIAVSVWYFSGLRRWEFVPLRILIVAVGPIAGVLTLGVRSMLTAPSLSFGRNSNVIASGGFGPNQVSAAFSFGALFCFLFLMSGRIPFRTKALLGIVGIGLLSQSLLTFSRGGFYMFVAGAGAAMFFLARDPLSRRALVIALPLLTIVAGFLILPRLNSLTGGALVTRFTNTGLTGRDELIQEEVQIFKDHPLFGVGPGMSRVVRETAASHTELTRLIAEHGLLGIASMVLLLAICAGNILRAPSNLGKAWSVALVAWAMLFMVTAALRMAAPAIAIGLSAVPLLARDFGQTLPGRLFRMRIITSYSPLHATAIQSNSE